MAEKLTFKQWLSDTAERALSTYIQTFIVFATGMAASMNFGVLKAAALAAIPAAINVLYQALAGWEPPKSKSWALDVLVRCARTFLYTALGLMITNAFSFTDTSAWQTAAAAGLTAVLVVVKSALAERRKGTITPASFVKV